MMRGCRTSASNSCPRLAARLLRTFPNTHRSYRTSLVQTMPFRIQSDSGTTQDELFATRGCVAAVAGFILQGGAPREASHEIGDGNCGVDRSRRLGTKRIVAPGDRRRRFDDRYLFRAPLHCVFSAPDDRVLDPQARDCARRDISIMRRR